MVAEDGRHCHTGEQMVVPLHNQKLKICMVGGVIRLHPAQRSHVLVDIIGRPVDHVRLGEFTLSAGFHQQESNKERIESVISRFV